MRLIGPLIAALAGLIVIAFASEFYDAPGSAARRADLTERLKKVVPEVENLERYAARIPPPSRQKALLPADVPVVEERSIQYLDPETSRVPDGIAIEAKSSFNPAKVLTGYRITNSRQAPVELELSFDYCTDDDFLVETRQHGIRLQAGESRKAAEDWSYPPKGISKVEIRAEELK